VAEQLVQNAQHGTQFVQGLNMFEHTEQTQ
jgi:hypothetical protein